MTITAIRSVIDGARQATEQDPANAQARFRADGTLVGVCEVAIEAGGIRMTVDEPTSVGGSGAAAGPGDYALAALASCHAVTFRFWAETLDIAIDSVRIRIEADMDFRGFFGFDETVRPGFGAVEVNIEVSGPELPARYEELRKAVEKHCPILDVFRNPVPVTSRLTVVS